MFEPIYEETKDAIIKVIGVGGGGGNALNHMVTSSAAEGEGGVGGVEFFSVNTDAQVLRTSSVRNTIQIGAGITGGKGCGGNPNKGHQSAEEDRDAIANMIDGADMVFIAVGMGGGTGTGAAPVIAEIAKQQGALTVGIVTKPFNFEGRKRSGYAEQGIKELAKHVDSLIIIQNEKLLKVLPKNIKYNEALAIADDILRNAVLGITDMITSQGLVNVDFEDVKSVMSEMGRSMMGTGIAEGENRAELAAKEAVASPLLEDVDLSGAQGILVNISSGFDLELQEVNTVMEYITSFADPDATIIYGSAFYPEMEGKLRVTLVATGIGHADELQVPAKMQPIQHPTQVAKGYLTPEQPAPTHFGGNSLGGGTYQPQPTGYSQPEPVAPKPQQVDATRVFSPNSMIPGFIRNGGQQ
ncbi:cell division protein FtsZ [Pasteurellaceae bacterium LFhippo2]|nr:cell division protein FtsZ [Pasteurellaceae bacterium LFhippo2]